MNHAGNDELTSHVVNTSIRVKGTKGSQMTLTLTLHTTDCTVITRFIFL